jgi:hypothetical protein
MRQATSAVRSSSAVASSAASETQRRQHAEQRFLSTANGVNQYKRPSGLVRIE